MLWIKSERKRRLRSKQTSRCLSFAYWVKRWGAAYHRIETVLGGGVKTRLKGEPIDNVELLGVKSAQVNEIKAQINAAATLVDAMFTADPDQTVINLEAQGTRRTAAEVKVHECEELVMTMQAAIDARNAADAEAAAAAAAAAAAPPAVVAEVPAATMKITSKFQ